MLGDTDMEKQLTTINKIITTIDTMANEKGVSLQEIRFTFDELYNANPDVPKASIRARVYEKLGVFFERIGRGIYIMLNNALNCIVIEGDSREVNFIPDGFAQLLVNDHPWEDYAATRGGNRNFTPYDCFIYTLDDFKEKFRILQQGGFLVEFLPAESHTNFEYLYKIKKMAIEAGFEYYSKVTWIKEGFVSNTGRKSKNTEDVMIFTKGKARALRVDAKKTKQTGVMHYMSGANAMLPTAFSVPPVPRVNKIHQSEKPVELLRQIISLFTKPGEIVIDQFAGSGVTGEACLTLEQPRQCILIEKAKEFVEKIAKRLDCISINASVAPLF